MQPATDATVLGDFSDATIEHFGVRSNFTQRDGKYIVHTDGADGALQDFEISYVFGVYPLQQYLVEFPDGRYQTLPLAWDSRPKQAGGQRWFHLYPNEAVPAGDILHWTGPQQNWNYMCAECHSTNLRKNWDTAQQRYSTTWSEIDVSCEACHGPASAHVAWARAAAATPDRELESGALTRGLLIDLHASPIEWVMDPTTGISKPSKPSGPRTEIEMCARCHARRTQLFEENHPGRALLDTHKPALLEQGLYFADGQQQDEVYEYGSFLQSRMYAAGVTCSNCHDPHSLRIEGPADETCLHCHAPERFATPEHHHHAADSPGARCVECHMPTRNYMVVDARRDHSFGVPRPDVSQELDTPNACTSCHADKSAAWAQDAVAAWYPKGRWTISHPACAIEAGRRGLPQAEAALIALIDDPNQSGIVRATALELLSRCLSPNSLPTLARALSDADGLVRSAAVAASAALPASERLRLVPALLRDSLRGVRLEAALALADEAQQLKPAQRASFDAARREYRSAQATNADRPESHAALGAIAARLGERAEAERAYETGLKIGPWFAGLWINLADLRRESGDEAECERLLRRGLEVVADKAALHHALGLCLARQQRLDEALVELKQGVELAPDDAQLHYVYGVALLSAGRQVEARDVFTASLKQRPLDRDLLYALATLERDLGNRAAALVYAQRLLTAGYQDPTALALIEELRRSAPAPSAR